MGTLTCLAGAISSDGAYASEHVNSHIFLLQYSLLFKKCCSLLPKKVISGTLKLQQENFHIWQDFKNALLEEAQHKSDLLASQ